MKEEIIELIEQGNVEELLRKIYDLDDADLAGLIRSGITNASLFHAASSEAMARLLERKHMI